jgi:uncharacterized protein (TIGR02284 family)
MRERTMDDPGAGEALNDLRRSALDSAESYRQAATLARNPKFQSLFRKRTESRRELAKTIATEVRAAGVEPAQSGTVIGEAQRMLTHARDVFSRKSDKGLVEELIRHERTVVDSFEVATEAGQAPEAARRVAAAALETLKAEQRELEGLGDAFTDRSGDTPEPEQTNPQNRRSNVAAHFKLSEDDGKFLGVPKDASVLFAGSSGTQTWIERAHEGVVRIGIQAVGVATDDGGSLAVSIEVGDQSAKGEDGPAAIETHLNASQAVQLLVKPGDRVAFKAYPTGQGAQVLRTVVWASDLIEPKAANGGGETGPQERRGEANPSNTRSDTTTGANGGSERSS